MTPLEVMNHIATDIAECPGCLSENVGEIAIEYDDETQVTTWHMRCEDCGHKFEDTD